MVMRIAPLLVGLLLLLGCGNDAPPNPSTASDDQPAGQSAPDPPNDASRQGNAPPDDDAAAPPDDRSPEAQTRPAPPPDDAAETVDLETLKQEVEQLVRGTRFREALQRCLRAELAMPAGPERRWVSEKIVELTRARRQAVGLPFAMEKLGPDQPTAIRNAARQRLREAGEVGRIYLRKAVRDRQPAGIAAAAAELLGEWGDPKAANLFTRELADPPPDPLRTALVDGAVANVQALDLDSLLRLARFAAQPPASGNRPAIDEALERAARRGFDPQALDALQRRTINDPAFEQRHVARLMAMIYAEGAARQDERFNAMFTVDDALAGLRGYAERAAGADDARIARWGEATGEMLEPFDFEELRRGLLAWWSFDQLDGERIEDRTRGDHDAQMIGEPVEQTEGVIGAALWFPGDNRGVESRQAEGEPFRKLHEHSFSFAAWVKPDRLPAGDQPDPYWGIVTKEGWHIGLMLRDDGRFAGMHYLDEDERAHPHSKPRAQAGRWHHLVMSVDVAAGTNTLYIEGEAAAQEAFAADAEPWDRYRDKPVRVGLARFAPRDWACRFRGAIDEVAIYERALTDDDVKALHRLRSAAVREKLLNPP